MSGDPIGLPALERQVARELAILAYPAADWVVPRAGPDGGPTLDCAVIGAGQFGLAIAAGLRREQVARVTLFDGAVEGREGPWLTFARMAQLRTPKELTGPDLGLPSLGVRAWWEAQHGAASWDALFRIPRVAWMEYLGWYRRVLGLDVRNGWALDAIEPAGAELIRLRLATAGGARLVYARTVVLATGAAGSGGYATPAAIADAVPPALRLHANDVFDVGALRGLRVGILGAGASAFDTAAAALEAGAAEAHLCFRRRALPLTNPRRWMENAGFLAHFFDLPDARRWAYLHRLHAIGQPPPAPTYERATALPGFHLHPATPWNTVTCSGGVVHVRSGAQRFTFDRIVVATGMTVDLGLRPEYAAIRDGIALWSDRYAPPPALADPRLGRFPYLGAHGEFTERVAGTAPWLARLFTITRGATLSLGPVAASNSGMKYVAPRLIAGVKRRLLLDQEGADWDTFLGRDHAELHAPGAAA